MDSFFNILFLVLAVISVILAIVAITLSLYSIKESRNNYEKTRDTMADQYEKTKSVLAEIDKRATVTETKVTESQDKLLSTFTKLIDETLIPKKVDKGEQLGMWLMQTMAQNPDTAQKIIDMMTGLMEKTGQFKKES